MAAVALHLAGVAFWVALAFAGQSAAQHRFISGSINCSSSEIRLVEEASLLRLEVQMSAALVVSVAAAAMRLVGWRRQGTPLRMRFLAGLTYLLAAAAVMTCLYLWAMSRMFVST